MKAAESSGVPASDNGFAASVGALAVAGTSAVILTFLSLGPLSSHMAIHIATMNVAAPLTAVALMRRHRQNSERLPVAALWLATVAQMALLWASHSPAMQHAAHASLLSGAAIHVGLYLSALAFWTCIVRAASSRWQAMLALLVSGKLACLLGALLIFAPRLLFDSATTTHGMHAMAPAHAATLGDQHLAGLLMIVACPLSYVLTAVVLAAQTITGLEKAGLPVFPSGHVTGS